MARPVDGDGGVDSRKVTGGANGATGGSKGGGGTGVDGRNFDGGEGAVGLMLPWSSNRLDGAIR